MCFRVKISMNYFKKIIKRSIRSAFFKIFPDLKSQIQNTSFDEITGVDSIAPAIIYAPYILGNSVVGDYTYLAHGSRIDNTKIGRFCSIGPNFTAGLGAHPISTVSTSPMFYSKLKQNGHTMGKVIDFKETEGVKIGHDVWIGMNVSVLNGVKIGNGAVIGAGAVVTKDIPPYAIALGVPAKVYKMRFSDDVIEKLQKNSWYNIENEAKLSEVAEDIEDVEAFLKRHPRELPQD